MCIFYVKLATEKKHKLDLSFKIAEAAKLFSIGYRGYFRTESQNFGFNYIKLNPTCHVFICRVIAGQCSKQEVWFLQLFSCILAEAAVADSSALVFCSQNFLIVEGNCVLPSSPDTQALLYVTKSLKRLISL